MSAQLSEPVACLVEGQCKCGRPLSELRAAIHHYGNRAFWEWCTWRCDCGRRYGSYRPIDEPKLVDAQPHRFAGSPT